MRILATGASGFLGRAVVRALQDAGHTVRTLQRRPSGVDGTEDRLGSVTDPDAVASALDGVDAVMHVAAVTKGLKRDDYFRVNHFGTRQLVEAAVAAGVERFVHCSTLAAAGPMRNGRPSVEEDEPRPVSLYGTSKLAGEEAVRRHADRIHVAQTTTQVTSAVQQRFLLVPAIVLRTVSARNGDDA